MAIIDIPSLWSWQKAGALLFQDAGGVTPAVTHGDSVALWGDSSGNGRDWTAATATEPTLDAADLYDGQPTVDCAGSGGFLLPDMSGLTAAEMLVVLRGTDSFANGAWDMGSQDFDSHFTYSDGVIYDGFGSTVRRTVGNPGGIAAAFQCYIVYSAANAWRAFTHAGPLLAEVGANTVSFPAAPRFGVSKSGLALNARVAHTAIFSAKLSDADRAMAVAELITVATDHRLTQTGSAVVAAMRTDHRLTQVGTAAVAVMHTDHRATQVGMSVVFVEGAVTFVPYAQVIG